MSSKPHQGYLLTAPLDVAAVDTIGSFGTWRAAAAAAAAQFVEDARDRQAASVGAAQADRVVNQIAYQPGQFFVLDYSADKEPHQIIDRLFVGSEDAAMNQQALVERGVTHIVNVATNVDNYFPEVFTYCRLELLDVEDAPLATVLPIAIQFIHQAVAKGGGVFVHCNAGVSRSVSICIAYLLLTGHQASYDDAYQLVRLARPVARPNIGFVKHLKTLRPTAPYHNS